MTNRNLALLAETALTVPKIGPTPAPKRLTSMTRRKLVAFSQVVPQNVIGSMIDRERKLRIAARRNQGHSTGGPVWKTTSVYDFAGMADWPTKALRYALWTALSELWIRGDVRRRTWPWDEDPLAFMIEVNPQFWTDMLDELEVERLLWPLNGSGPYPRAKLHRALKNTLVVSEEVLA